MRLDLARQMGAHVTLNPATDDVLARVRELTHGDGVDLVCEMSGHPSGHAQAFAAARLGGRVNLLGTPSRTTEVDFARDVIFKGLTLYGVTGILFILIFSVTLDWLPFVYTTDIKATGFRWVIEQVRQAIMPVMVLGLFQAASMTRFVRSAMLDVIRLDYVTTARAKGLGQARVIVKHAMRNALIPVVTLVALQMPAVFGGAIVTEQIFRIPGIGSLLISSILSNDTPVVMAVTFVFACLVVLFNLIADVLYGWLDPRISLR